MLHFTAGHRGGYAADFDQPEFPNDCFGQHQPSGEAGIDDNVTPEQPFIGVLDGYVEPWFQLAVRVFCNPPPNHGAGCGAGTANPCGTLPDTRPVPPR